MPFQSTPSHTIEKGGQLSPYKLSDISHGFYIRIPLENIAKGEQRKLKEIKREEETTEKSVLSIFFACIIPR